MRLATALLAVVTVSATSAPARGALMLPMDLPALTTRADHVVLGQVRAITCEWTSDHRRIYSRIDLDVVETWRSTAAVAVAHVSIWQPGGEIDGFTMLVTGMPTYAVGERAVLFLKGAPARAKVVGGALGKLPVHTDAVTGDAMVMSPQLAGATLVGSAVTLVPPRPTPVARFRALVRQAAVGGP
jgi:hypothetical protein